MDLPDWVKVGVKYRYPDHRKMRLLHVRAVVDGRAVVREWSRQMQAWQYTVVGPYWFYVWEDKIKHG